MSYQQLSEASTTKSSKGPILALVILVLAFGAAAAIAFYVSSTQPLQRKSFTFNVDSLKFFNLPEIVLDYFSNVRIGVDFNEQYYWIDSTDMGLFCSGSGMLLLIKKVTCREIPIDCADLTNALFVPPAAEKNGTKVLDGYPCNNWVYDDKSWCLSDDFAVINTRNLMEVCSQGVCARLSAHKPMSPYYIRCIPFGDDVCDNNAPELDKSNH
ncbi:hypothetical protein P9112_005244 [Eukaryota sp. TZLM1-RC]